MLTSRIKGHDKWYCWQILSRGKVVAIGENNYHSARSAKRALDRFVASMAQALWFVDDPINYKGVAK